MKSELVPLNGDPPIPITRDVTLVGRREFCDVVIPHPSLSKRHCVIVRTDGLLIIRDLATTNGTKVNGQRVMWAALLPNDRLSLGGYKMRVYLGSDEHPSPSELAASRGPARAPVAVPASSGAGMGFVAPTPEPGDRVPVGVAFGEGFTDDDRTELVRGARIPGRDEPMPAETFALIDDDEDDDAIIDLG